MLPVRVGVIGAGSVSQQMHVPFLRELNDRFELTGICDASAGVAAAVAARHGVGHTCTDHRELLGDRPEAVIVAIPGPPDEIVVDALAAGAHVLVEKPMAWSAPSALRIEEAAARAGRVVLVGYMKRYDPGYLLAERLLRAGDLGPLLGGTVRCVAGPNELYIQDVATIDRADDVPLERTAAFADLAESRLREAIGDVGDDLRLAYRLLLGISCRELSVLRGLIGAPRGVRAAEVWAGGRWFSATLAYDGFSVDYLLGRTNTRSFDERFELFCADGTLALSFPSPFLKHAPATVERSFYRDGVAVNERSVASYEESFRRELEHFHDCIRRGASPRTPASDGTEDAALLAEIVRVAAARR